MTLPLSIVAGLVPGIVAVGTTAQTSGMLAAGKMMGTIYTGYDYTSGKWSWSYMQMGLMPLLAGFAVHKLAGMVGLNRMMAQARIPLIRI